MQSERERTLGSAKWTATDSSEVSVVDELSLFAIGSASPYTPITVEMELSGKSVRIEVDTGATVSPMAIQIFKSLCRKDTLYFFLKGPSTLAPRKRLSLLRKHFHLSTLQMTRQFAKKSFLF